MGAYPKVKRLAKYCLLFYCGVRTEPAFTWKHCVLQLSTAALVFLPIFLQDRNWSFVANCFPEIVFKFRQKSFWNCKAFLCLRFIKLLASQQRLQPFAFLSSDCSPICTVKERMSHQRRKSLRKYLQISSLREMHWMWFYAASSSAVGFFRRWSTLFGPTSGSAGQRSRMKRKFCSIRFHARIAADSLAASKLSIWSALGSTFLFIFSPLLQERTYAKWRIRRMKKKPSTRLLEWQFPCLLMLGEPFNLAFRRSSQRGLLM